MQTNQIAGFSIRFNNYQFKKLVEHIWFGMTLYDVHVCMCMRALNITTHEQWKAHDPARMLQVGWVNRANLSNETWPASHSWLMSLITRQICHWNQWYTGFDWIHPPTEQQTMGNFIQLLLSLCRLFCKGQYNVQALFLSFPHTSHLSYLSLRFSSFYTRRISLHQIAGDPILVD